MRLTAIILSVRGIGIAAGNVWAFFIEWLSLLGILVPPIGAIDETANTRSPTCPMRS
jgi:cytosine permease